MKVFFVQWSLKIVRSWVLLLAEEVVPNKQEHHQSRYHSQTSIHARTTATLGSGRGA
jgi:hypothetical protein